MHTVQKEQRPLVSSRQPNQSTVPRRIFEVRTSLAAIPPHVKMVAPFQARTGVHLFLASSMILTIPVTTMTICATIPRIDVHAL